MHTLIHTLSCHTHTPSHSHTHTHTHNTLAYTSQPSLITVCANNIMHKWSLVDSEGNSRLVLKRTYRFQGGLWANYNTRSSLFILVDVYNSRVVHQKIESLRFLWFSSCSAKTITTCCLPPHCDCLFVGTLGGITYPMDTEFDGMSPEVLSWSRARA